MADNDSKQGVNYEYVSYNGMNRPALKMGIPLMPLLFGGFLIVFGGFGGLMLWGVYGFIFPVFVGLILFSLKIVCEDDPNGLEVIKWKVMGILLLFKQGGEVLCFGSGNDERMKKTHAQRFFRKLIISRKTST